MSAPLEGYGQQPPADQPYTDQPQQGFEGQDAGAPPAGAPAHDHGKKKKRGYATQAYEFGAGGNAAAATPGAAQPYGAPAQPQNPQAQPYGAQYPGQDAQQPAAPQYGAPASQYGAAQPGAPAAAPAAAPQPQYGYQAPDASGYPGAPAATPGVAGINQQMAGMNIAGQPQAPPAQAAARPVALNQLYPTDLLNQPFNVSELDLPPPPIILPPNVGHVPALGLAAGTSLTRVFPRAVQRHPLARCQLLSTIRQINPQRRSHDTLPPQEVEASFCAGHPTLWLAAR